MESELALYSVSGNLDSKALYSTSSYAIILIDKPSVLEYYKSTSLLYICSRDCLLYIVILSRPYINQESFLEDVSYMLKILWKRKLSNVVVTGLIGSEFWFTKSSKFRSNELCIPGEPKTVESFCVTENNYEDLAVSLFRVIEFNQCIIKAAFLEVFPYSMRLDDNRYGGVFCLVLNEISYHFDFQVAYDVTLPQTVTDIMDFMISKLTTDCQFYVTGYLDKPPPELNYLMPSDVSKN